MKLPRTALAAFLVLPLLLGAADKPTARDFDRWMDAYLAATPEARAEDRLGADAQAGRQYLLDLLARDPRLAACLPKEATIEVAALLTLTKPRSRFKPAEPDDMVRDAVLEDGRCAITQGRFLDTLLRSSAKASPAYRTTIRTVLATFIRTVAQGETDLAACLAKPASEQQLLLALGAYFATLDERAEADAYRVRTAVRGALARLCPEAAPPQVEYFRDEATRGQRHERPSDCNRKSFKVVERKSPEFPRRAIDSGIESGSLVLHLRVQPDGSAYSVRVMRTDPEVLHGVFDRAARTLLEWKFEPGDCPFIAEVPIEFKLPD